MTDKHPIVELINTALEEDHNASNDFRSHLGGSMIGRKCARDIWYGFRWAAKGSFSGRILRLFQRGHLEEFRFVQYLERVGIDVQAYSERLMYLPENDEYHTIPWVAESSHEQARIDDSLTFCTDVTTSQQHVARAEARGVTINQWRIKGVDGHFGGSLDGIATKIPNMDPEIRALLEFKTHNTKSFCKLVVDKVRLAKPEHYAQMQVYMHNKGLLFALYMAVNKNDDDLYVEIVEYDYDEATKNMQRAEAIVYARTPPARIGNNPSWYDCKYCNHNKICHYGEPMHKSCRSCVHSKPVAEGQWLCEKWNATIPREVIATGCDAYKILTD